METQALQEGLYKNPMIVAGVTKTSFQETQASLPQLKCHKKMPCNAHTPLDASCVFAGKGDGGEGVSGNV